MNKYRAKPVTVDNVRFASKAEAARYTELKILYRSGKISELILHPRFEIRWPTNDQKRCSVILDFQYTAEMTRCMRT